MIAERTYVCMCICMYIYANEYIYIQIKIHMIYTCDCFPYITHIPCTSGLLWACGCRVKQNFLASLFEDRARFLKVGVMRHLIQRSTWLALIADAA